MLPASSCETGLPDGCGWLVSRCQPVIQSAVVTISMPASRTLTYRSSSGKTPWNVSTSGSAAMISSMEPVAVDAVGRQPGELAGVLDRSFPVSSSARRSTSDRARSAIRLIISLPTLPVATWNTRIGLLD